MCTSEGEMKRCELVPWSLENGKKTRTFRRSPKRVEKNQQDVFFLKINISSMRREANMRNGFTACHKQQQHTWPLSCEQRTLFSRVFRCMHKLFRINILQWPIKQTTLCISHSFFHIRRELCTVLSFQYIDHNLYNLIGLNCKSLMSLTQELRSNRNMTLPFQCIWRWKWTFVFWINEWTNV